MSIGPSRAPSTYAFAQLDEAKARVAARGVELIDFGVGDPRDPTPEFIRRALVESIPAVSSYPRAGGIPELRNAISAWTEKRFGKAVDPADVVPTLGSKEIIHSLPAYLLDDTRDTILIPSPAYPVYERGARFHGASVYELPLSAEREFLPDLDAIPAEVLRRTALMWINYPNNPTGFTAPLSFFEEAADLARTHGFVLASDEAYTEIYFGAPPVSVLQLDNLDNVLAVNTLSKRSCMTGYRSGFVAGDPKIIGPMVRYRPTVGVAPQAFVQHAAVAAWSDEEHVTEQSRRWKAKRDVMLDAWAHTGLVMPNDATFFLWIKTPEGETSAAFAERLLDMGIVVSPGVFFGQTGEGYIRIALVPTIDDCKRAADILRNNL